jgi:hypothetical protein
MSRKQHHRLPVAQPPATLSSSATNPRLNECFDLIRTEFDTAAQEGGVWKIQRDEYEQKGRSRLALYLGMPEVVADGMAFQSRLKYMNWE